MKIMHYNPKFNSLFTLLFIFTVAFSISQNFSAGFWLSAYVIYFLSFALGVGMTLHRVVSHSAADLPQPLLYFFSFLGSVSQAGPPIKWLLGHNLHHKYADTNKDPILPTIKGLNHMLGQFIEVDESEFTKILFSQAQSPVFKDRFLKSLNAYLYLYTFGLYAIVFLLFGVKGLSAFLIGNLGALVATSLLTYLAHVKSLGTQHHKMPNSSVNMYGTFLLFFGEEIHNNHHARPKAISNSESPLQIDIIGFILSTIKKTEHRRSYV